MAKIPLMEGERGAMPFIVNRSVPFVVENRNGINFTRIPGRFSICDSVNGNNRRYPKKVWEKNLADGSTLRQAITKNAAFGLLEHPNDGRISLQSPICILVTDAKLQAGQDESTKKAIDEVVGEIIVVNTAEGQKLRALIEAGYNPMVSSRGFGSVVKGNDGVDEVQDDYICEGWDCVLKPSFDRAELLPSRESKQQESQPAKLTEQHEMEVKRTEGVKPPIVQAAMAVFEYARGYTRGAASGYHRMQAGQPMPPAPAPPAPTAPAPAPVAPAAAAPAKVLTQQDYDAAFENAMKGFKDTALAYYTEKEGPERAHAIWNEWETSGQLTSPEFRDIVLRDPQYGLGSAYRPESKNLPQASSSPAAAAALSAASAQKTMTEKVMTINEIKSRIGAIQGAKVPKDPTQFAEGLNEMAQLHQEIANFIAEDAKREWQGKQLHREVKAVEKAWSESVLAPRKAATKLTENYQKVLKVTKVLGEAAIGIRKKLSEALAQNAEAAELIEELTERGQAWVAIADKRKGAVAELEHKLEVACEALDIIKTRYHEDMTQMGGHVITLEFAEKAQAPDIQKLLKEAKKPADIIAIREKLDPEGAKKAKQEAAAAAAAAAGAPAAAAAAVNESKGAPAAAAAGAPAAPAVEIEPRVLVPSVRSISESVAMVQRLSTVSTPAKEEAPKK